MLRWILLTAALVAINPVTDWLVDFQFKQEHQSPGYTRDQAEGMRELLDRELARKPAEPKPRMSAGERAAAMTYLWGDAR